MATLPKSFWWAAVSLGVMVVGAIGPWAKVLGVTIRGIDDGKDGWVVLGAAAVAALLLGIFAGTQKTWLMLFPVLAAAIAGATAGYDISDIESVASGSGLAGTGWGIYAALIGSISLLLASLALVVETRRARPAAPPAEPPAA